MQIADFSQLPQPVQIAAAHGAELAQEYTRARGDYAADAVSGRPCIPPGRIARFSQLFSLCFVPDLGGSVGELRNLARDGRAANERSATGDMLHRGLGRVPLIFEGLSLAQDAGAASLKPKSVGDTSSSTASTQVMAPADELVQLMEWREIAPPLLKPEFGATRIELPKLSSTGKPEIRSSLSGKMPQFGGKLAVTYQNIGYLMGETQTDALVIAQWARGQVNLQTMLDTIAVREMEAGVGQLVYMGEADYSWSAAQGTPVATLGVKVDGTVPLLVAGVLNTVAAFEQGLGTSNLKGYKVSFVQMSEKIAQRLRHPYGDASGRSGIEYLMEALPGVTFTASSVLDNIVSGESHIVCGARVSGGGGNRAAIGMQAIADEQDTIMPYQDGPQTRVLRLRGYGGTYSPYSELIYSEAYDTVT